jgi:hypothetical protein
MYQLLDYWDKAESLYKESLVELREELNNKERIAVTNQNQKRELDKKRITSE